MAFIKYNDDFYLDTEEGYLFNKMSMYKKIKSKLLERRNFNYEEIVEFNPTVDYKTIELGLYTNSKKTESKDGFLVEVYLSGSDGKLTRLYGDSILYIDDDSKSELTFTKYMDLELE